jgi:hypothetical protein
MRWRWAVVVVGVAVLLATIPLYRSVKQEYIPSDVDESEFSLAIIN